MKLKTSLLGAALCLGAALPVLAQTPDNGTMAMPMNDAVMMAMSAQDQVFVIRAAEGNLAEITLGQAALGKTKNAGVKNVAQTIIAGHGQAQTELMGLMKRKSMAMMPMLSPTHRAVSEALGKAKGANFDRMYMANQTDDHENAIALFQSEVMNGQDADLKAYASKYLPDIVGHTIMIYAVARQVGAPGSQMRPMLPPIPPGVTPTMMGKPIDMSSPTAMMSSMGMDNMAMMNMDGKKGKNNGLTPLNTTPVPTTQ